MEFEENIKVTTLPNIVTNQLILKLPKIKEAELMCNFFIKNKQHFLPWEAIQIDDYYTQNYWLERIEQINKDFLSDKSCCFNIYKKEDKKLIGMVNYTNFIRGAFHSCFLGFKIAKEFKNKGYMTLALKYSTDYIFDKLNLHRIAANYMPSNKASAKVLEKCGFKQEGIANDYLYINGKWERHVLTSLINGNWKKT